MGKGKLEIRNYKLGMIDNLFYKKYQLSTIHYQL